MWAAFVLTLLVPSAILFRLVGFYLVFKLAVLDYVYFRFPRLREKYDTSPLMWDRLPTDAEWAAKRKAEQVNNATKPTNRIKKIPFKKIPNFSPPFVLSGFAGRRL